MNPLLTVLACLALYFGLISLAILAGAIELSITGNSTGQGIQNLSFVGDLLNVSITQNGSSWNLTLGGMA